MAGSGSRIRTKRTVTLQDVAEYAGVSTATVSRALNGAPTVGDELRAKVEAAVRSLQYTPNHAARALASNRSRTIGAIVPTLDNAIFAKHIGGFQQRLAQSGYTMVNVITDNRPACILGSVDQ